MRHVTLFAAVLFAVGCAFLMPAHAEVVQAQNSRVIFDVPNGFVSAKQFAGFQNDALQTSFVVVDMPAAAYDQLKTGLTPEGLAAKGVMAAKPGTLARADDYIYLTAEQKSPIGVIAKFLLVLRDTTTTAFITGNVPKAMITDGTIDTDTIEKILASASFAPAALPAKPAFSLSERGRFTDAGAFMGTARLYTLDGKIDPAMKTPGRAVFIVGPSLDLRPVGDLRAVSRLAMEQMAAATNIKITSTDDVTISGLQGVAIKATAKTTETPAFPLAIYQVILVRPEGGYFRMIGRTSEIDPTQTMAEFERMARSFKMVE
jgi:hypothetical protein